MGKKLTARELMKEKRAKMKKRNLDGKTYEDCMGMGKNINPNAIISGNFDLFKPDPKSKTKYAIDIIPYIAGRNSPIGGPDGFYYNKEGRYAYTLCYYDHPTLGDSYDKLLCLEKTFGKKCPICEHRKKLIEENGFDKDMCAPFNPSWWGKHVYNVICRSHKEEEDKGVQIWIQSAKSGESKFMKKANDPDTERHEWETGEDAEIAFYDSSKKFGRTIKFYQLEEYRELDSLVFIKRNRDIPKDELDGAYCLENLLTNNLPKDENGYINFEVAYEEIKASFWGEEKENNEGNEGSVPWDDDEIIRQVKEIKKVLTDNSTWDEMASMVEKYSILSDIDADRYDDDLDLWEAITDKLTANQY